MIFIRLLVQFYAESEIRQFDNSSMDNNKDAEEMLYFFNSLSSFHVHSSVFGLYGVRTSVRIRVLFSFFAPLDSFHLRMQSNAIEINAEQFECAHHLPYCYAKIKSIAKEQMTENESK